MTASPLPRPPPHPPSTHRSKAPEDAEDGQAAAHGLSPCHEQCGRGAVRELHRGERGRGKGEVRGAKQGEQGGECVARGGGGNQQIQIQVVKIQVATPSLLTCEELPAVVVPFFLKTVGSLDRLSKVMYPPPSPPPCSPVRSCRQWWSRSS